MPFNDPSLGALKRSSGGRLQMFAFAGFGFGFGAVRTCHNLEACIHYAGSQVLTRNDMISVPATGRLGGCEEVKNREDVRGSY